MEWISVSDRLPELGQRVLFYDRNGLIHVATYELSEREKWKCFMEHGAGWDGDSVQNEHVTHWMPIPTPPETK